MIIPKLVAEINTKLLRLTTKHDILDNMPDNHKHKTIRCDPKVWADFKAEAAQQQIPIYDAIQYALLDWTFRSKSLREAKEGKAA